MNNSKLKNLYRHLAMMLLGAFLAAPQMASATALSISQSPLFITISLPPNISVLLDSSGSMASAFVPDSLDDATSLIVYEYYGNNTPSTVSTAVSVSCSQSKHGVCSKYSYSCPSGYSQSSGFVSSGTSSTAPSGDACTKQGAPYSCPSGFTASTTDNTDSTMTCAGYTTESVQGEQSVMFKSAAYNPLAYDPSTTYSAPYDSSGNPLSTSFTKAWLNGLITSHASVTPTGNGYVDLSSAYRATVSYSPASTSQTTNDCDGTFGTKSFSTINQTNCHNSMGGVAAYYYVYKTSNSGCTASIKDSRCYTKVTVSSTSGPNGTDERQNFANWYSFYRTRNLTTASSANQSFTKLSGNMRVAWIDLDSPCNTFSNTCKGWTGSTSYDGRIGAFTGAHRQDFINWVNELPADTDTPLRLGLETVGAYYKTSGTDSPYAFTPHTTDLPEYVCRPNYGVVMTDGLWNDSTSSLSYQPGNLDDTDATLPDNTAYSKSQRPYTDSSSNSLADIAFYYWSTNLRPSLGTSTTLQYMPYPKAVDVTDSSNNTTSILPYWNPQNDPATWPHMVTFTVSLGQTNVLTNPAWGGSTFAGDYPDLVTGNKSWPTVSSNSSANVYDLWHAAINSRGQFFSADSPQDMALAFNSIVSRIQGRVGSSSAIAVNSTRLDSNTFIYQAQFNSSNWTGEVQAFQIQSSGGVDQQNPTWKASEHIPAPASRKILTWNPTLNSGAGGGTTFAWGNLSSVQQTYLNTSLSGASDGEGQLRLAYLTGDQSDEQSQSGGIFRTRATVLGDIVDSNPYYAGTQGYGFSTSAISEGSSYAAFVAAKATTRGVNGKHMLYVGGNDGMLHGFNADTGDEVFAYIPRGVYPNLSALTDPLYVHQFYVDGSPNSVDAYVGGAWKTLLVGTTGAGARDVFLLDVSDPANESASSVLWDYDAALAGDSDLGYTIGEATIVRMHDGHWYVLLGNGYNSPNNKAEIYLYDINSKVIRKFDTGVGSGGSPNGMSSPNPIDFNGDRITDAIYAGDLLGNIWKLDVSDSNPSNWHYVAYGNGSTPTPLFTAKDANNNVQPITDKPQVGLNVNSQVMVLFGTGTYFLTGDNAVGSNPPVQSFYGIIDDKGTASGDVVSRSNLLQQFILAEASGSTGNNTFRVTSSYSMTSSQQGWYLDLLTPPVPGTAVGERVVSDSVIDGTRIVFTTLIPQGNACSFGGISWLMELDLTTGAQLAASPLDTNGDGQVNDADLLTSTITYTDPKTNQSVTITKSSVGGEESTVGIIKTPGIINSGELQYKYTSGSTGAIMVNTERGNTGGGRLSWQQLQ